MFEPTERLLWLCVGVVVTGAVGLAVPAVGAAAPVAAFGIVVFAVVDFVLASSPASLVVRRVLPEQIVEGRAVASGVVVEAPAGRRVDVEVVDALPGADEPWPTFSAVVDAGERVTLTSERTFLRRGRFVAGRVAVRTRGPLGLVRRRQRRTLAADDGGDRYAVGVDLGALLSTAQRLVQGQDSSGGRKKRAIERGRELDSLREYRRGDDVRLVDWKASARKDAGGAALIVKEMVPETRQDVVVVVDAGRQLTGVDEGNGGARFDAAVHAALVLCAAALVKGDRCGVGVLQDEIVAWEPPREGKAALARVADAVAAVSAEPLEPGWQTLAPFLKTRLKRRALVVVVTDVVDEAAARALAHALASLRGRHLVVVVATGDPALSRLARADAGAGDGAGDDLLAPFLPVAAQKLLAHRKRALKALEADGAVVVDAPGARAAASAVDAYLALKSSGRM